MKTVTITLTFEAFDDDDAQDFKENPTLLPSEEWIKQKYLESGLELANWRVDVEQIRGESPKRLERRFTGKEKSSSRATESQVKLIEMLKITKVDWNKYRSDPDKSAVCSLLDHNPSNLTVKQASTVISFLDGLPTRITLTPGAVVAGPTSGHRYQLVRSKAGTIYAKVSTKPGDPYTYDEGAVRRLIGEIVAHDPSFTGIIPCTLYPDISDIVGR